MDKVVARIRDIRKEKGFSHKYMAHSLGISQVAYSKIEKQETKLTVERLYKITEILETKITQILGVNSENIYNQDLKDYAVGHQEIQNMYQDNKEVYEKLIASKDEQIALLKTLLKR